MWGVRGPLSQRKIEGAGLSAGISLSDPGLQFFWRACKIRLCSKSKVPSDKICFIAHEVDRPISFSKFSSHEKRDYLIDNYDDLTTFLASLSRYSLDYSSSLHELFFCHVICIPAIPMTSISSKVPGGSFKFRDYLYSLALTWNPSEWVSLPDINEATKDLLRNPQPSRAKIAVVVVFQRLIFIGVFFAFYLAKSVQGINIFGLDGTKKRFLDDLFDEFFKITNLQYSKK